MLKTLIVILFMLGYTLSSAQDYIVTIKRDTLWGEVKYFLNSGVKYSNGSSSYVQVTPAEGKKSTHQVLKTLAFRMDGENYHTVKYGNGYQFMKLISSGYLSMYAFQFENQTTWDGRYLVKKDGGFLDVPHIGFKKWVIRFLADCPAVTKKVELGELSKSELGQIVDEYNACIELKTATTNPVQKSTATEGWLNLEVSIKQLPDFAEKADALEMVREIQSKVAKNENVPAFLINGLKDALKDQSTVKTELDKLLQTKN